MKTLVKSILRTKLVDGLAPHTLTSFIYSDGSTAYKWQTPNLTTILSSKDEYLEKLKYIRDIKRTEEGYEEPYKTVLVKYKDKRPTQIIRL